MSAFCDFCCCCCNYWEFFLTRSILKDLKSVFVIRQDYILAMQSSKLVFLYFSALICKDATSSFRMTLFCTFEILLHFMIIVQSIRPLCQREKKNLFCQKYFLRRRRRPNNIFTFQMQIAKWFFIMQKAHLFNVNFFIYLY